MSCNLLTENLEILKQLPQDNLVLAYAQGDIYEQGKQTYMVLHDYVNPQTKHNMATLVSITDPGFEQEIDLTQIQGCLDQQELKFKVGSLFHFYPDPESGVVAITQSPYNKTEEKRFENIYDYITFYLSLQKHIKCEEDDKMISDAIIQGSYALCRWVGDAQFLNSQMCENGKTEAHNNVEKKANEIKQVMFRERLGENFFYDLSIKTLDCLEDVNNYFHSSNEKFVCSNNIKTQPKTM